GADVEGAAWLRHRPEPVPAGNVRHGTHQLDNAFTDCALPGEQRHLAQGNPIFHGPLALRALLVIPVRRIDPWERFGMVCPPLHASRLLSWSVIRTLLPLALRYSSAISRLQAGLRVIASNRAARRRNK